MTTAAQSNIASTYQYWRDKGAQWVDDYDRHKRAGPKYHIPEFVLCGYIARIAEERPLRVLEFGCGPGRHLRYLRCIPGVEPFGYDQSETMVQGMHRWSDAQWIQDHITLGDPTQRLPYADGAFDIVFTASVLVHVLPADLPGRLAELLRICRGEVIHVEPRPTREHRPESGSGCFSHDLIEAYSALSERCEDLSMDVGIVPMYRVRRDDNFPNRRPSPVLLGLYDRMLHDLTAK